MSPGTSSMLAWGCHKSVKSSVLFLEWGVRALHRHAAASPSHWENGKTGELHWTKLDRIVPSVSSDWEGILLEEVQLHLLSTETVFCLSTSSVDLGSMASKVSHLFFSKRASMMDFLFREQFKPKHCQKPKPNISAILITYFLQDEPALGVYH